MQGSFANLVSGGVHQHFLSTGTFDRSHNNSLIDPYIQADLRPFARLESFLLRFKNISRLLNAQGRAISNGGTEFNFEIF